MLNLDELDEPRYEITIGGEKKDFDPIVLAWEFKDIAIAVEPKDVQQLVNKTLSIEVSVFQAAVIVKDFFDFCSEKLEGPLKNVLGPELSSLITSASGQKNNDDSPTEKDSDTSTVSTKSKT